MKYAYHKHKVCSVCASYVQYDFRRKCWVNEATGVLHACGIKKIELDLAAGESRSNRQYWERYEV